MNEDFLSRTQPAGDRFAEKRAVPRYHMVAEIEVFEPIQRTKLTAYTAEIGTNGCYVRVPKPLQRNTVIQVRILKDRLSFKTWGRVVHAQEGTGMGIAFFRLEPNQEKILQGWIAELRVGKQSNETEQSPAGKAK
jgi:hypothetical protein